MLRRILSTGILVFLLTGPQAIAADPAAEPGVFRDLTPKAARDLATTEGKILLVRWTATWCGPCKRMDKTTWPAPTVVKWVADNAIAISADLDAQRKGATIQKISAVPTIVAFKDGKELDRLVGYRDAAGLLVWLETLKGAAPAEERLNAQIAAIPATGDEDEMNARRDAARRLDEAGRFDEAGEQYVWLWRKSKELPISRSVVRDALARSMASLAYRSPSCRTRFIALRDEAWPRIFNGPDFDLDAVDEWITLSVKVFGDRKGAVAWAEYLAIPDECLSDADPARNIRHNLIRIDRWDLASQWIDDPLRLARIEIEQERADTHAAPPTEQLPGMRVAAELAEYSTRLTLADLHALALIKGAESDAQTIANEALAVDPSDDMRIAMVQAALSADRVRQMHADLLKACPTATEFLRERVNTALTNQASPQTPPAPAQPSP